MKKRVIRITEGHLHSLINESVNKILFERYTNGGFISNDGNHMVGGEWASSTERVSTNILNKFIDEMSVIDAVEDEIESFIEYCESNYDEFNITAQFSVSYDESTGYGSKEFPVYEIESINGDENAKNAIYRYKTSYVDDDEFKEIALNVLEKIIEELSEEDFEFNDDYEYEA